MTNMIRKTLVAIKAGPGAIGLWCDKTSKRLFIDRSASSSRTTVPEVIRTERIIYSGAGNVTLTEADDGATVVINDATSRVVSLPATKKALRFGLIIQTVTAGAGHALSPVAADKIMGNGFTSADNKDAICTGATDREGDSISVVGDGADGWFIDGVTGTWAREA